MEEKKNSEDGKENENWERINISPLKQYGFNAGHIRDIMEFNLLDWKVVQESIYHFAYALETKKAKYNDPINVLVGRLCKGKGWFEPSYISEKDQSLKQLVLIEKQKKRQREEMIKELVEVEYEGWRESLSKDEESEIEKKLPKEAKTGHSVIKNFYWKEHFEKTTIIPRLEKEGVIKKEKATKG